MKENDLTQRTIPAEFVSKYHHKRGALAAARTNNPEKASSWCQFYIVQGEVITEEQIKNQFAIDQALFRKYYNEYVELEENADLKNELISLYNSGDAQGYQDRVLALVPECESHFNVKIRKEYSPQRLADYSTVGGSPHLDDQYTVFGMVVDGLEVVDSIAAQSTTPADKPLEDIYITMKVDEMSRKKITKEFGYQYPE